MFMHFYQVRCRSIQHDEAVCGPGQKLTGSHIQAGGSIDPQTGRERQEECLSRPCCSMLTSSSGSSRDTFRNLFRSRSTSTWLPLAVVFIANTTRCVISLIDTKKSSQFIQSISGRSAMNGPLSLMSPSAETRLGFARIHSFRYS